jgi:hypothetical protein
VTHWLRHGCAPEPAGEKLAEAIPPEKPRSLADLLDELATRERLGGAVPYVAQMVSALTLPPRRLDHSELPLGGYSDVTTRGQPEQLLPSQFAVEDLEFVRRFAQNELLYFRREEPTSQVREELMLLLDQGVRCWGVVRLLLSAAVLAFGKLAVRRRLPLLIAGSSTGGEPLHVRDTDLATLGKLVDASDLSANPGRALERALEEPTEALRDVVIMTHPRALREEDVIAAARRAPADTRLFALAVNDRGQVQLSELRHGVAVASEHFRVDLTVKPKPEHARVAVLVRGKAETAAGNWSGCVEPIGFPFRIGITSPIETFGFDHEGQRLITISQNGTIHAWALDGSGFEIVPRALVRGSEPSGVVQSVKKVLGVNNGFVIIEKTFAPTEPAYYDFGQRTCEILPLKTNPGLATRWFYCSSHNSVVAEIAPEKYRGIDLSSREIHTTGDADPKPSNRVQRAWAAVAGMIYPRPQLFVGLPPPGTSSTASHVLLNSNNGELAVRGVAPAWVPFVPLADGKPLLKQRTIAEAQCNGGTLAVLYNDHDSRNNLLVFRYPDGVPLGHYSGARPAGFLLSPDGRWLARQSAPNQVIVHEITRSPAPVFVTAKGRCHQDLYVEQGHHKIVVQIGNWLHLIRWDRGSLELAHSQGDRPGFLRKHLGGIEPRFPGKATRLPCMAYDQARFRYAVQGEVDIVVDVFGQLAVFDRDGNLVAMFFVFRSQVAAWMPDGTRYGPSNLIGGPSTEGALDVLGRALRNACRRGQRGES